MQTCFELYKFGGVGESGCLMFGFQEQEGDATCVSVCSVCLFIQPCNLFLAFISLPALDTSS
jgi:hypothetical protein